MDYQGRPRSEHGIHKCRVDHDWVHSALTNPPSISLSSSSLTLSQIFMPSQNLSQPSCISLSLCPSLCRSVSLSLSIHYSPFLNVLSYHFLLILHHHHHHHLRLIHKAHLLQISPETLISSNGLPMEPKCQIMKREVKENHTSRGEHAIKHKDSPFC